MSNTATRLITLIMLLQRRPNQKAADLAESLGISVRSLHRYIGMLDDMGIPIYSERGPYGGFSLVRGYKMPPLVFTPEEAVAVELGASLVGEMWGPLYEEAARGALAKLENVLPDEQRRQVAWARQSLVATGMHHVGHATLAVRMETLRRALRDQRRVHMTYEGRARAGTAQRDFDPYALVHRWGWWYVVGFCQVRQDMRTFRVDRIAELVLLDDVFERPATFDIHEYLAAEQQTQPSITVRMRFTPEAAALAIYNRAYWQTLEECADGSVEVTFAAPDLDWGVSTALPYGPLVVVLEPAELATLVKTRAAAIAARYAEDVSRPTR